MLSLTNAISTGLGAPQWVAYDAIDIPAVPDASAQPKDVFIGETYTIDPGDNLRMETITVLDVQGPDRVRYSFERRSTIPTRRASRSRICPFRFGCRRSDSTSLSSKPSPRQIPKRDARSTSFARMVRAVSTWNIVQEDPLNPGFTGTFTVGVGPLGYQTIGVAIPP